MCRKILCSSCCCCYCCCKRKPKLANMESEHQPAFLEDMTKGKQKPGSLANNVKLKQQKPRQIVKNSDTTDNVKDSTIEEELKSPDENTLYILSKFTDDLKTAVLNTQGLGQLNHPKEFILIGYRSQFIAGTDYFLKIYEPISENYYHLRVYESLQGDLTLLRMSAPKKESDPILYF